MDISYSARRVASLLTVITLVLGALSLAGPVIQFQWNYTNRFIRMFDIGLEATVPTWYSSIILFISAVLLALIAIETRRTDGPFVKHWAALGLLFLLFSIDEVAMFHERVDAFLSKHVDASGFLLYIWVVPGALFALAVAVAYLRFLWHLPVDTRWMIIAAGVVFVTGALGLEMLQARHHDLYGYETFTYAMLYTAEELMEKLGVVLFIYALLVHLERQVSELRIVPATRAASGEERSSPAWQVTE
jgi:hypothetical protein